MGVQGKNVCLRNINILLNKMGWIITVNILEMKGRVSLVG
jgi:hypothetical protein